MEASGDPRSDAALLAAALAGDADAFGAFYRRHARRVAAFQRSRTADAQDAADLTAETFAVALEQLHRFDPARGEPLAWLLGIAHHRALTLHRRGRVEARARRRLGLERLELDDDALQQVEAAGAEPVRVALREGLEALPPDQREAVAVRVLLDGDYGAMAAAGGVSEAVVRKRVSRGLAALRHRLTGRLPSP
jgi:RNA polymerase sigma-70 factor (ECF subfamily)